MKKLLKFLSIFFVMVGVLALVVSVQVYQFVEGALPLDKQGYLLVIPSGTPVQKIADTLYQDNIIKHRSWFLLLVRWQKAWNKLKAGEYLIQQGETPVDLIQKLVDGRVVQHALTIVEGWTFDRMMAEINQSSYLKHTLNGLKNEDIMSKLGHGGEHPEGRFLPETYYYPAGTTDVVFLQRAYNLMSLKLEEHWEKRLSTLPLRSAYEALILASIIEKESCCIEEYAEIAGVYVRRLQRNMPLQADPTVIYGLGKFYQGLLMKEDLKKETPYNTYVHSGLPPTPIALPSQKALEAVMHPKPGETLYFVAKRDGKGHVFSKTLEEHRAAVADYRKASLQGNN